jgi:preprotein translocase subunit SecD
MKKTMLILALLVSASIAQNRRLANGVYAIEKGNAAAKNLVVRQRDGKDVVLDTRNFVPLTIEGKPAVDRSPRGSGLGVQLAPEAAKRLEDLTRSRLNRSIAIVVSDRILSTPTVRSVITDGKARLTPCADESCETLLRGLNK